MQVSKVYFDKVTEEEKEEYKMSRRLIGFATVVFDGGFVVNDIMVMNGNKGEYLVFPQTYNGKNVAYPINEDFRVHILYSIKDKMAELNIEY